MGQRLVTFPHNSKHLDPPLASTRRLPVLQIRSIGESELQKKKKTDKNQSLFKFQDHYLPFLLKHTEENRSNKKDVSHTTSQTLRDGGGLRLAAPETPSWKRGLNCYAPAQQRSPRRSSSSSSSRLSLLFLHLQLHTPRPTISPSLTCCCSHPTHTRTSLKRLLPWTTGEATPRLPGNHNAHHQRDLFSLHLGAVAAARTRDLHIRPRLYVKNRAFRCHGEDGNQKLKASPASKCPFFMIHGSEEGL